MENLASRGAKRKHVKRNTGCDTCRNRRVRCDETRPRCQNCVKYGRNHDTQCTYPTSPDFSKPAQQANSSVVPLGGSWTIPSPLTSVNDGALSISRREHFLMHHLLSASHELEHSQDPNLGIRLCIRAIGHAKEAPFLHDCLCGMAVQHLYEYTKSNQLLCERYHYRDKVLVGLRQHLAPGNAINYGAVLSACAMLSWDAHDSDEFFRCMQGIFLVLDSEDANADQSDLVQLFLPVAGHQQITKWREKQSELLESAMQSLNNLTKLVKEEPMMLGPARELRNYLQNLLPLQTALLAEPAQLKALFPVRSWLPWIPTLPEQINDPQHKRFFTPFLASCAMVKMAHALVFPGTRHAIGLHQRAMAIQAASIEMGSGFVAGNVHTSSVMRGPLLMAQSYLSSSPGYDPHSSFEHGVIHTTRRSMSSRASQGQTLHDSSSQ
ncbi:hypothetical protein M436DRAFT_59152 [Aureobasidium namibiae CBS 147.97]|uniref:Zn(2)-C6 fungal-type domain-containing protein n=1 Tax=Aureobasidium namibiae CBS 147.97 TaxID=1043004 RepID=A0A074X0C6_9PEZI|nr:uncharacterized protein M436DRAFT_59152 [Aureobasidium namibiae CBS 147.97]KEQ68091.1 hypothetical protein M436DRAFT_59152 [Aureobasidium namibiae CBS 147.97]